MAQKSTILWMVPGDAGMKIQYRSVRTTTEALSQPDCHNGQPSICSDPADTTTDEELLKNAGEPS